MWLVDVSCPKNCGKEFQRKDLEKHLEDDCPNRTIPCTFCAEEVLRNSLEVCCGTQFTVFWVEKAFTLLYFDRHVAVTSNTPDLVKNVVFVKLRYWNYCGNQVCP